jgi:hypothetical protein
MQTKKWVDIRVIPLWTSDNNCFLISNYTDVKNQMNSKMPQMLVHTPTSKVILLGKTSKIKKIATKLEKEFSYVSFNLDNLPESIKREFYGYLKV